MSISSSTTIQAYQLKKGGTPARMAILRMIAADSVHNRNPDTRLQPGDWKGARKTTLGTYEPHYCCFSSGENNGERVWYTHAGEYFRGERDAHEITKTRHTGWYTDDSGEMAIGIVARLPHNRFLAGYRWTSNGERVYFGQVFDDETDAARMADEHARVFADSAREGEEHQKEIVLAELDVETKTTELEKAIALRHRAKFGGKPRVLDAIAELRKARDTLANLEG